VIALALLLLSPAEAGRADVGGYFRVMTRPDLQGGSGQLGYWNLYGRLLNERPYATIDLRYEVLERQAGTSAPWSSIHARVEGGSIGNADAGNGNLANLRLSQVYVTTGNVLIPNVTWQVGTLDRFIGDLGLYDMRPAQLFFETVGASAWYQDGRFDVLLGVGDSGYTLRGEDYSTIFTGGGWLRLHVNDHLEVGGGGQYRSEPGAEGNRSAPYATPALDYEDWIRGETIETFLADNPEQEINFPDPVASPASSGKAIGYLGFGGFGPVLWNNLFASYERLHPSGPTTETYQGQDYTLYVTELTDERHVLTVGNELQLRLIPRRLDVAWGFLYGLHTDGDNDIAPSDHDRSYRSTVLRAQVYATPALHWLVESSLAEEVSTNGNAYREHADSIFANTASVPDSRGLEVGDTDTRYTWQGKTGVVLSPLGPGIYTRPSLRLLYGAQYSNQNNAFGNSFVETLDQYNEFGNVERHWHHVISLETEAWF
jgi:lysozyme family protein